MTERAPKRAAAPPPGSCTAWEGGKTAGPRTFFTLQRDDLWSTKSSQPAGSGKAAPLIGRCATRAAGVRFRHALFAMPGTLVANPRRKKYTVPVSYRGQAGAWAAQRPAAAGDSHASAASPPAPLFITRRSTNSPPLSPTDTLISSSRKIVST